LNKLPMAMVTINACRTSRSKLGGLPIGRTAAAATGRQGERQWSEEGEGDAP
jgi:hypothetical protein